MMNQGESTADTVTSLENHKINDSHQVIAASYSLSNSAIASWNVQGENLSSRENGVLSGSSYNHDQPTEPTLKNVQEGVSSAPIAPSSSTGPANAAQGYSGYAAYQNTDPYGYNAAGYAAYYNQYQQQSTQYQQPPNHYQQQPSQYQQQSNQYQQQSTQYQQQSNQYQQQPTESYSHHVGTYQNTGAAYQPLSSFQNSGSYAGPPSYSGTYYNPGNYQTSASYKNGTYGTQSNLWHGGQYATYSSHPYPNYTPDSNPAYSSTSAVATSQYAHHYNKQWEDYYNQNQTEVSCAPGTENIAVSTASSLNNLVPSGSGGYAASNSQIPAASNNQIPVAYTPSWRPEPSSSELAPAQPTAITGSNPEVYWKNGASTFPNDLTNTLQPTAQKPLEVLPAYNNFQNQPNPTFSQGSTALYPNSYQASQGQQSSFQTVSQPPEPSDSRRASKLQIQTNPRIASNLPLSVPKDKDSSMTSTAAKPSYISVLMQKTNEKVMSHDEADSMLKPGTFPKSLRGYVERALARCKNDRQKAASQVVLKEVITKATTDGTLYTRDWDTEPLFPMPNTDGDNNQDRFPLPSTVLKNKSPTRRAKSRWEPMSEEKMVDKSANILDRTPKYGGWNNKQFSGGQMQNKDNLGTKSSDNRSFSKNVFRPMKRQRLGDSVNAVDDDETSSDSDAEKFLTKHSAAAIVLSQSPEEKRRRENRSKRFDRGHGNRAEKARAKDVRPSNLYARRANAMVLSRNFEEIGSRAVEDIDWDSLTIKGTCQEIEKRYLRLTSAPDPATVRPEEVLEKALRMVQTSPKNYLYKCDQLKSIRQDLTVQRIRNELTVKVYETHARMAIEFGDLPEYNQCQSQLKTLYSEGIPGSYMEFAAYNLLCVIMHSNNNRDLLSAMSRLSADAKKNEAVKHALAVHSAVASGNYVMFFRLYKCAPNLNTFLMDVEKMRYAAVKCISRSYRPTVPVSYISQILGFNHESLRTGEASDDKDVDEWEECVEWLKAHGASVILDSSGETLLDTKASVSTLYMPDPEDAVSHGDANLAVNDFLARNSAQAN